MTQQQANYLLWLMSQLTQQLSATELDNVKSLIIQINHTINGFIEKESK